MTLQATGLEVLRGGKRVIENIDLSFERKCLTAVLGPNGAGKSTLLGALAGLIAPARGRVALEGAEVSSLPPAARARRIGYLPQSPEAVWPVTVHTLVSLARIPHRGKSSAREDEAAIQQALARTDTAQWVERDVQTLSGGERARVMLARVIAGEPEWVLADEPFTGLDPAHQFDAADLLRSLADAGCGVIFTLHDLTLAARVADRVVVVCQGKVSADGPPDTALTPGLLRDVYNIEAEWIAAREGAERFVAVRRRHAS
jgi:iron complex transport system ATP-binding protein